MKLKEIIKRVRLYAQNPKWQLTDYFIEAKNIVESQASPNDKDFQSYTCIRDYNGFCIYIPDTMKEEIYKDLSLYNSYFKVFNVSELRRRKYKRNILGKVYNRISPAIIKIKIIEYIKYKNDSTIYLIYMINLTYNDDIYKDLLNYKNIEYKYN